MSATINSKQQNSSSSNTAKNSNSNSNSKKSEQQQRSKQLISINNEMPNRNNSASNYKAAAAASIGEDSANMKPYSRPRTAISQPLRKQRRKPRSSRRAGIKPAVEEEDQEQIE